MTFPMSRGLLRCSRSQPLGFLPRQVEMTFPMSRGLLHQWKHRALNCPEVEMTFPMSRGLLLVGDEGLFAHFCLSVEMTFPMSRGLLPGDVWRPVGLVGQWK